ncbi:MAG: putative Ig domain-containing protein [Nannocystaceae bacterium]
MTRSTALLSLALLATVAGAPACAGDDNTGGSDTEAATTAGTSGGSTTGTSATESATGTSATSTSATGTSATETGASATESTTSATVSASDPSASGDPGGSSETFCENFLPLIEPDAIDPGAVGAPYEVVFMVPGLEPANTSWTVEGGDLPDGLEFDVATGTLAGTPTTAGRWMFDLIAAPMDDIPGCPTVPTSQHYTLVIDP